LTKCRDSLAQAFSPQAKRLFHTNPRQRLRQRLGLIGPNPHGGLKARHIAWSSGVAKAPVVAAGRTFERGVPASSELKREPQEATARQHPGVDGWMAPESTRIAGWPDGAGE